MLFPWAFAAEDQLDARIVFGFGDGLDDEILPFLWREASRHRDHDLIRVFARLLAFDAVEVGDDAVRDDVEFVVAVIMGDEFATDHPRGTVDMSDVVE